MKLLFASISFAAGLAVPLTVVPSVDLSMYQGVWYEIARYPNRFQNQCAGDVTAKYELRSDGKVRVVNRCRKKNGEISEAEGIARLADIGAVASHG